MNKDRIEVMCRNAGLKPELRENIRGVDIFIADGFSAPPHRSWRRFGVEADEFPLGCYVTLWWASRREEQLDVGQPLFFDAFHDRNLEHSFRPKARINAAMKEAAAFLKRRRNIDIHG